MPDVLPAHPGPLAGRRAVVTGGASGIGAAVATTLAGRGAEVLILDRDGEAAAKHAADLGGDSRAVDLADPAAVAELALDADVLVNGAGVQHVAPIEDFEPARFELIHRLMLLAPFLLTQQVLPGMYARRWGRIVHVSSVHGHRASPYKSAYVSAKHGLEGLSKVIALEGADSRRHEQHGLPRATSGRRWSRARSPTRPRPTASPRTTSSTTCCSPGPPSSGSSSPTRSPRPWPSSAAPPPPP